MHLKKWIYLGIISILSVILLAACQSNTSTDPVDEETQQNAAAKRITVYTSFYPLYDFATKIAGEHIEIVNLLPAGAEPHDYEPTARDIISLNQAQAFFYNGGEFESWIETMVRH